MFQSLKKVRAKRLDNGEWYDAKSVSQFTDGRVYIIEKSSVVDRRYDGHGNMTGTSKFLAIDKKTLGYEIGLRDKHGNDIYEDDILRIVECEGSFEWTGVVAYTGCGYVLVFEGGELPMRTFDSENIEIIGNVHDNPELIKEG